MLNEFEIYLEIDSTWTKFNPIVQGSLSRTIQKDYAFDRIEFNGDLLFYGDENEMIITKRNAGETKLPIKIYQNSNEVLSGDLILRNTHDYDKKQSTLKVKTQDVYTPIFDNIDTKFNLFNVEPVYAVEYSTDDFPARKVFGYDNDSVIEYIINQIFTDSDYSISFFNSYPSSTDSFYYFRDNAQYNNLFITHIRNITSPLAVQTEIWDMSFELLMNYLLNKHWLTWRIIEIGGLNVFQLKHYSELNYSIGTKTAHNLTNYFHKNWSVNQNSETYEQEYEFNRLTRETIAGSNDFLGRDIILPNIENAETKSITLANFYTDYNDIKNNGANYEASSNEQFAYLACDANSSDRLSDLTGFYDVSGETNFTSISYSVSSSPFFLHLTGPFNAVCSSGDIVDTFEVGTILFFQFVLTDVDDPFQLLVKFQEYTAPSWNDITGAEWNYDVSDQGDTISISFPLPATFSQIRIWIENIGGGGSIEIDDLVFETRNMIVRDANGAISGSSKPNADLSQANTDDNDIANMPDELVNINGSDRTLTTNKIQRYRQQVEIFSPVINIKDNYDFSELVETDLDNMQLISIEKTLSPGFGKIKLKR